jgi:hypothetical protein
VLLPGLLDHQQAVQEAFVLSWWVYTLIICVCFSSFLIWNDTSKMSVHTTNTKSCLWTCSWVTLLHLTISHFTCPKPTVMLFYPVLLSLPSWHIQGISPPKFSMNSMYSMENNGLWASSIRTACNQDRPKK